MSQYVGIDFSGNHKMWAPNCRNSNVWIAVVSNHSGLQVETLFRVQELDGQGHPFQRLVQFLRAGQFRAVAIDAPFSVPQQFIGDGGHQALLRTVLRIEQQERPFSTGEAFVREVCKLSGQTSPPNPPKPLRCTEQLWRERGINIRSSLWNGARPGAPMTTACLTLLAQTGAAVWPWSRPGRGTLFVEAFPAAQLQTWRLPFQGYGRDTAAGCQNRHYIVEHLNVRGQAAVRSKLIESADALDAVVAAFAGIAVKENHLLDAPRGASSEGWIAVYGDLRATKSDGAETMSRR